MTDSTVAITDNDVAKFQATYKKYYGIELNRETAVHKLHQLLRQTQTVYRPVTAAQVAALKNENENSNDKKPTKRD